MLTFGVWAILKLRALEGRVAMASLGGGTTTRRPTSAAGGTLRPGAAHAAFRGDKAAAPGGGSVYYDADPVGNPGRQASAGSVYATPKFAASGGSDQRPAVSAELQPGYYSVAPDRVLKLNPSADGYDMPEGH